MRPLKQPYTFAWYPPGTGTRTVRPYPAMSATHISIPAILQGKMAKIEKEGPCR